MSDLQDLSNSLSNNTSGINSASPKRCRPPLIASAGDVFIDLTLTSDDESSGSRNYQADSDLEIISQPSRSPLTISVSEDEQLVLQPHIADDTVIVGDSSLPIRPSAFAPSENLPSLLRNRSSGHAHPFSTPRVDHTSSSELHSSEGSRSLSSYHRPREDVIEWLNDIEPFGSHNASAGLASSSLSVQPSNVQPAQCNHCGNSVHVTHPLAMNYDYGQPSTSARPDLQCQSSHNPHRVNRRRVLEQNRDDSVLERMLSTPPLSFSDEAVQLHPITNPNYNANFSSAITNFQLQQFAGLSMPPPAHSGPTNNFASGLMLNNQYDRPNFIYQPQPNPVSSGIRIADNSSDFAIPSNLSISALRQTNLFISNLPSGNLPVTIQFSNPATSQSPIRQVEPLLAQSQRANQRYFNQVTLNQPPFSVNPTPVDFLPASVLLQGLYPDFPGIGLTSSQIERHTSKFKFGCELKDSAAKKCKSDFADENYSSCSVCLDGFEEGQTLRRLTCQHLFHADCVDEWLKRRSNCPNCRLDIRQNPNSVDVFHHQIDNFPNEASSSHGQNSLNSNNINYYHAQRHSAARGQLPPRRNARHWPFISNR